MTFLLDVNVLIALIDPLHVKADAAHQWFEATPVERWATCPLTENGLVRIVGNPRYRNSPGAPAVVARLLRGLRERPGHQFWPDAFSLLDPAHVRGESLLSHTQVTDTYLLALARLHGGLFASFDPKLSVEAVPGGRDALHLI